MIRPKNSHAHFSFEDTLRADMAFVWGALTPQALEERFRDRYRVEDVRQARWVIVVTQIVLLYQSVNAFWLLGSSEVFWWMQSVKLLFFVASAFIGIQLGRPVERRAWDAMLLGWAMSLVTLVLVVAATRPPEQAGHLANTLLVLLIFFQLPLPLRLQVVPAISLTIFQVGSAVWWRPYADLPIRNAFVMTVILTNVLGVITARYLSRLRRLYFAAVTDHAKSGQLIAAEKRVLELITAGANLSDVLETLVSETEALSVDGMLASVLLIDECGSHLKHGAAPSLPVEYCRLIDGVAIGPAVGSCGTAAHERRPIDVSDISNDPLWFNFKHIAISFDLRACCSTPLLASTGELLGTIAMYYREPRLPSATDRELIARATKLATIAIERHQSETRLRLMNEVLEARVADRTRVLAEEHAHLQAIFNSSLNANFTIDRQGFVESVNSAAEKLFGYRTEEMVGRSLERLMPSSLQGHILRENWGSARPMKSGLIFEVVAQRRNGEEFAVEVEVNQVASRGFFSVIVRNVSERKRLERDAAEATELEQSRIGQDLHDSVGQQLTALGMLTQDLLESLESGSPATFGEDGSSTLPEHSPSQLASRIQRGLQEALQEVRVISRGLNPVPVDSQGLMAALKGLADQLRDQSQVSCQFHCPRPVDIEDNLAATHLFHIAQEALGNALRHAQARQIHIRLVQDELNTSLSIQDDGIGLPWSSHSTEGLGLRIMRSRAAVIGARLSIQRISPQGTEVFCKLPCMKGHPPIRE